MQMVPNPFWGSPLFAWFSYAASYAKAHKQRMNVSVMSTGLKVRPASTLVWAFFCSQNSSNSEIYL